MWMLRTAKKRDKTFSQIPHPLLDSFHRNQSITQIYRYGNSLFRKEFQKIPHSLFMEKKKKNKTTKNNQINKIPTSKQTQQK